MMLFHFLLSGLNLAYSIQQSALMASSSNMNVLFPHPLPLDQIYKLYLLVSGTNSHEVNIPTKLSPVSLFSFR